jgi:hypothetical protein
MSERDREISYLDEEDWQIAFEPYAGHPLAALTLSFHLTKLKRDIDGSRTRDAIAAIDLAIDCLYEHSEFRSVSRELFLTAIQGKLTTEKKIYYVNWESGSKCGNTPGRFLPRVSLYMKIHITRIDCAKNLIASCRPEREVGRY